MLRQLFPADDGALVPTRVGDEVELVLPGKPSGGYRWLAESLPDSLEPAGEEAAFAAGRVGGGNETRLRFRVTGAGAVELRLRYARSWEADEPALKTFSVSIEARNSAP